MRRQGKFFSEDDLGIPFFGLVYWYEILRRYKNTGAWNMDDPLFAFVFAVSNVGFVGMVLLLAAGYVGWALMSALLYTLAPVAGLLLTAVVVAFASAHARTRRPPNWF